MKLHNNKKNFNFIMMITHKILIKFLSVLFLWYCPLFVFSKVNLSFLHQLQRMYVINKDCNAIDYFKPTVSHGYKMWL